MADEQTYGVVAQARRRPYAVAIIDGESSMTYAELDDRCRRMARLLQAHGVGAGDRVAVMVRNSAAWFVAVHGGGRLGAVVVPVNTHSKRREAHHVVTDSGARAVVVDPELAPVLDGLVDVAVLVVGAALERQLDAVDEADVAVVADGWPTTMLYTSGTTGLPKGVAPGADDFRRRAAGVALMATPWSIGPDDRYLLVGPAYHGGPAIWAQVHLAVGGTVVIMDRWDERRFCALVAEHRVTITHLVPTNFIRLLELGPDLTMADLSSLRLVLHAAAPCPVPVKRRIMAVLPPDVVWEYYGASEGGGTSISPQEWMRKPGSVGRPHPGNEIVARDAEGRDLPPGRVGQLWARTATSSFAYHGDPATTAAAHDADGWFTVGDVGYLDADGYLFITDRVSDMVISGGVNIYPREIEDCLHEHGDVVDCAVFGVPDDRWGEALVALVEARPGTSLGPDDVTAWIRSQLADYKAPRRVAIVDHLPRDPNGKVRKGQLRSEWLAQAPAT